jgi:hypothetical protein
VISLQFHRYLFFVVMILCCFFRFPRGIFCDQVMELVRFELVVQGGLEDNDLGDETHLLGDGLQEGEEPQFKDEIDCLKQLVVKEGPASLYSGLVPQLLGIAP